MNNNGKYDLIVVGSGPAGLAGAFFASAGGKKVLLLEKEKHFGGKLPISGGAKCNVTNILSAEEQAASFGKKARFLLPALKNFPPEMTRDFFAAHGVPIEIVDGFHCFPRSNRASDVVNALVNSCREQYVQCLNNICADELLAENQKITGVRCGTKIFYADNVLLACGGKSYPQLGATGSGYTIAAAAGHTIIPPLPAMTGVHTAQQWCAQCAGIALEDVETSIALPGEKERCRGELIFTDAGISAFAVLDISGRISELLQQMAKVPLKLNLFAGKNSDFWQQEFDRWRKTAPTRSVVRAPNQYMPRKLAGFLVPDSEVKLTNLSKTMRREIITNLTALPLDAIACPWEKAMVTRGGVATAEIDPHTLESKIVRNLFFAGEVIDVDGPCGGYNIQWALSSGFTAGTFRQ